jgi:hypothetical protein
LFAIYHQKIISFTTISNNHQNARNKSFNF